MSSRTKKKAPNLQIIKYAITRYDKQGLQKFSVDGETFGRNKILSCLYIIKKTCTRYWQDLRRRNKLDSNEYIQSNPILLSIFPVCQE